MEAEAPISAWQRGQNLVDSVRSRTDASAEHASSNRNAPVSVMEFVAG
jgi:hypothetical protein